MNLTLIPFGMAKLLSDRQGKGMTLTLEEVEKALRLIPSNNRETLLKRSQYYPRDINDREGLILYFDFKVTPGEIAKRIKTSVDFSEGLIQQVMLDLTKDPENLYILKEVLSGRIKSIPEVSTEQIRKVLFRLPEEEREQFITNIRREPERISAENLQLYQDMFRHYLKCRSIKEVAVKYNKPRLHAEKIMGHCYYSLRRPLVAREILSYLKTRLAEKRFIERKLEGWKETVKHKYHMINRADSEISSTAIQLYKDDKKSILKLLEGLKMKKVPAEDVLEGLKDKIVLLKTVEDIGFVINFIIHNPAEKIAKKKRPGEIKFETLTYVVSVILAASLIPILSKVFNVNIAWAGAFVAAGCAAGLLVWNKIKPRSKKDYSFDGLRRHILSFSKDKKKFRKILSLLHQLAYGITPELDDLVIEEFRNNRGNIGNLLRAFTLKLNSEKDLIGLIEEPERFGVERGDRKYLIELVRRARRYHTEREYFKDGFNESLRDVNILEKEGVGDPFYISYKKAAKDHLSKLDSFGQFFSILSALKESGQLDEGFTETGVFVGNFFRKYNYYLRFGFKDGKMDIIFGEIVKEISFDYGDRNLEILRIKPIIRAPQFDNYVYVTIYNDTKKEPENILLFEDVMKKEIEALLAADKDDLLLKKQWPRDIKEIEIARAYEWSTLVRSAVHASTRNKILASHLEARINSMMPYFDLYHDLGNLRVLYRNPQRYLFDPDTSSSAIVIYELIKYLLEKGRIKDDYLREEINNFFNLMANNITFFEVDNFRKAYFFSEVPKYLTNLKEEEIQEIMRLAYEKYFRSWASERFEEKTISFPLEERLEPVKMPFILRLHENWPDILQRVLKHVEALNMYFLKKLFRYAKDTESLSDIENKVFHESDMPTKFIKGIFTDEEAINKTFSWPEDASVKRLAEKLKFKEKEIKTIMQAHSDLSRAVLIYGEISLISAKEIRKWGVKGSQILALSDTEIPEEAFSGLLENENIVFKSKFDTKNNIYQYTVEYWPTPKTLRKSGILIVDDKEYYHRALSEKFKKLGFRNIYCAFSPEEALEIFKDNKIDLLITDLNLKPGWGITLISEAQKIK
ncbi:MAG: response regulator, partial [Candidatus Omnitrophica bacterium]|nr:response regulator [Candidatus Omnitrophota bacterium]